MLANCGTCKYWSDISQGTLLDGVGRCINKYQWQERTKIDDTCDYWKKIGILKNRMPDSLKQFPNKFIWAVVKGVKLIKLKWRDPMPPIAQWFMETKRKVFGYIDSKVDFAINTGVKTFFTNIGLPLFIISIVAVVIFFVFIN